MSIYNNIVALVNDAIGDVIAAAEDFDYNPPAIQIPAVDFSTELTAVLPETPSYMPTSFPEQVTPTGDLDKAAYNAASSLLGSLSLGTIPSRSYATPLHAEPLPPLDEPTGVGTAPEEGFIDVLDNAGLTPVDAPTILVGERAVLEEIPSLNYDVYGIEKLDIPLPPVRAVPAVEGLSNPEQLIVQVDPNLLAAIGTTLDGQDILNIQPEMFELATEEDRRKRWDEERNLFAESASRGFDDSNGPLFEQLADLNYEATLLAEKGFEGTRDELYAIAERKLKEAITQSIALETANFAVHLSYASKLIEVFEINVKLHAEIFGVIVDLYQVQLAGVNALIDSYNAYVRTVLAEQSAKSAEIEEFEANVRTDQAQIEMFEAQIRTTEAQTDVYVSDIDQQTLRIQEYSAYIQGLTSNVDIVKLNIDAYREALRVYSTSTKADSAIIDAYAAQVRTEGSAVDVYKENWDVYGAAYNAQSGQNNAVQQYNTASLTALRSEINVFQSAASEQRGYLQALSSWISANNAVASDYERGVAATARFYTGKNAVIVDVEEANSRVQLAQASLDAVESSLAAQRDAAQATVDAGLLASEATTYAGQAQAAYAIRSISTQLGSTAGDSDSQNYKEAATESQNYRRSYSYTKSASLSA